MNPSAVIPERGAGGPPATGGQAPSTEQSLAELIAALSARLEAGLSAAVSAFANDICGPGLPDQAGQTYDKSDSQPHQLSTDAAGFRVLACFDLQWPSLKIEAA